MKTMMIARGAYAKSNVCGCRPPRPTSVAFVTVESLFLVGCGGAPSITIAGAYFPAWLLCALIAVLVAVVVRGLMVATGLSNHIPYQLAVCSSIGVIVALVVWQLWVVR
ncbi:YtcA family lipoprotein [Granulicella sp. L60]|uniref:YtcA family lipoprotein n=1 Tax=Granulicella sp. L60 TaxID=1641866 RepID=UPI001C208930|nr:YtcA family lipoprotein [Granulicella sp. L60]